MKGYRYRESFLLKSRLHIARLIAKTFKITADLQLLFSLFLTESMVPECFYDFFLFIHTSNNFGFMAIPLFLPPLVVTLILL